MAHLIGRAQVAEIRAALLTQKAFKSKEKAFKSTRPAACPPASPLLCSALGSAEKDQDPKLPREGTRDRDGPLRGNRNPHFEVYKASRSPRHPSTWSHPWRQSAKRNLRQHHATSPQQMEMERWPCRALRGDFCPSRREAGTACDISPNVSPFPAAEFPLPGAGGSGQALSHEGHSPALSLQKRLRRRAENGPRGYKTLPGTGDSLWGFPPGGCPQPFPRSDCDGRFAVPPPPSTLFLLLPQIQAGLSRHWTCLPFTYMLPFHHLKILPGALQAFL